MVSLGILNNLPGNGDCFQVTVSLEKRTPLKSSQEFLGVLQESVEPQPRGVSKREPARGPAPGPQKQMNLETLRACQRSGEEWLVRKQSHSTLGSREWERGSEIVETVDSVVVGAFWIQVVQPSSTVSILRFLPENSCLVFSIIRIILCLGDRCLFSRYILSYTQDTFLIVVSLFLKLSPFFRPKFLFSTWKFSKYLNCGEWNYFCIIPGRSVM